MSGAETVANASIGESNSKITSLRAEDPKDTIPTSNKKDDGIIETPISASSSSDSTTESSASDNGTKKPTVEDIKRQWAKKNGNKKHQFGIALRRHDTVNDGKDINRCSCCLIC